MKVVGAGTFPFVLPVKTGIHGGVTVGVRSYVEPIRSRRCAQPPLPHHGYRIGVRYSVVEGAPSRPYPTMGTASGCGTTNAPFVLPVKTGIHGGVTVGGTLLRRAGPWSKVRPATLTPPWVPHRSAARRCGVSGTTAECWLCVATGRRSIVGSLVSSASLSARRVRPPLFGCRASGMA